MKLLNDKRGASLVWAFVAFIIMSVFMISMQSTIIGSHQRISAKINRYQRYFYAKSLGNMFADLIVENEEIGKSITSYLFISGDFSIDENNIEAPYDMDNIIVSFLDKGENNITVNVIDEYRGFENEYNVNLLQKFILYDKDGIIVSKDYQGEDYGLDMDECILENYWIITGYQDKLGG